MKILGNLISMIFAKMRIFFGYKYDASVIPEGVYCYLPDYEKNNGTELGVYYIVPCKYFKLISKRYRGCQYLGIITDDFVFRDQCKMCSIKEDFVN